MSLTEKYPAGQPLCDPEISQPISEEMISSSIFRRTTQLVSHFRSNIAPVSPRAPTAELKRMSGTSTPQSGVATPVDNGRRKLKILMLHGYTQSGPSFHAKTKALEKALIKAFPPLPAKDLNPSRQHAPPPGSLSEFPGGVQLIYPTAPHRLKPSQIPGYIPKEGAAGDDSEIEAWAWWRMEEGTGRYIGLEEELRTVAEAIRGVGGVDAVMGFSQGGCNAAIVTSLLEAGRPDAFARVEGGIEFPESFRQLREEGQGPLRFAVSYAGFFAPRHDYRGFYEPKIETKVLHVIGSLDTVVEGVRTQGLVDRTIDGEVVIHPGGHFVPVGKEWTAALIQFMRRVLEPKEEEEGKAEENVEDMDMPF